MKTNNNIDITLSIMNLKSEKKFYVRRQIKESFLEDYKKICDEIKSVNSPKFDNLNIYNSLEIHLHHPYLEEFAIYNEEDWKFLYNYNIIQECVNKNNKNKIKIDFELKNITKTFNKNLRKMNFRKIMIYLMENIPQSFYFNIIIKFFKEYIDFDLADLFKSYVIEEILKTDLKSIKEEIKKNCDDLKQSEINFNNQNNYQSTDYSITTENFLNIMKYNSCRSINKIKNIIGNINEINEHIPNLSAITYTSLEEENINDIENEEINTHFTHLKLNNNNSKIVNENNLFINPKEEEYYAGIEGLKDHINKENLSQLDELTI